MFYRGDGRDHRGRLLSDIHELDFYELEFNHDYIQWLFPLPEPSGANASAPLLSNDDIGRFRSDESLRRRLLQSFELMLSFFGLELGGGSGAGAISVRRAHHFDERHESAVSQNDSCTSPSDAGSSESSLLYLMPITIESGPTSGSTRVEENPASFIHAEQSAPV